MIKLKVTLITCIILTLSFMTFGQSKLARIIDEDGFTYLRNEKSINSLIIDTIYKDDFFYCVQSNSDWLEITEIKWNKSGYPVKGFMHKSRIQIIENLKNEKKKILIESIFKNYEKLGSELNNFVLKNTYDNENKTWNSKRDSLNFNDIYKRNNNFSEKYFSPILKCFSNYFCETKDIETLDLFVKTLWSHKGSANEMLSFTLGECFICEPEIVQKQIQLIENNNEIDLMINHIDWGLKNSFWTENEGNKENKEPLIKEYKDLKKQLESLRK